MHPLWFQGPVTAPSRKKDIQQAELQTVQTLALNEPLYIAETQYTTNFEQFQLQNSVSSTPRQQIIFQTPKFEIHLIINLLSTLDTCMQ